MISADEYAIFSEACKTDLYNWQAKGTTFFHEIISDEKSRSPLEFLHGQFRYQCLKYPELLRDFADKNAKPWPLEKRFVVANGYQFFSERKIAGSDRQGNVFSLSRVGFNNDGKKGLLYLVYYGGPLCAAGHFLLFEKQGQQWKLKSMCLAWKS